MSELTHQQKIDWMIQWAHRNKCVLDLEGEVGFGRECVGITAHGKYADYHWYDKDYEQLDQNGEVWSPEDAYHKHECVAVLGRGEQAESQLYDWLKWFEDNGFKPEADTRTDIGEIDHLTLLFQGTMTFRMIKQQQQQQQQQQVSHA